DRDAVDIFFLHPAGRVSEVQRRQMTTVLAPNVHNIAIKGNFDDCQDLVKGLFTNAEFRQKHQLSAANSINWARIMAQIVYYFSTALELGAPDRRLVFSVPTGNFGNVYAGYAARRMGLPIERLIIGSNANDILTRYFETGFMQAAPVVPTTSPSMDIQVSSNFERLLFEHCRRDGRTVARLMNKFRAKGEVSFGQVRWRTMRKIFSGYRLGDNATGEVIKDIHSKTGVLLDPHSAIGVEAGRQGHEGSDVALISLATAHPVKFPEAVEQASGMAPALPARLAGLMERLERFDTLPNDLAGLLVFISERLAP
ncbi:MAG: threonine synthase, partial [Rhodospirillales bacterium]|nr:threonine synthase [Rhodospirillales bacterium]